MQNSDVIDLRGTGKLKEVFGRDYLSDHEIRQAFLHGSPKFRVGAKVGVKHQGISFEVTTIAWSDIFSGWCYYIPADGVFQSEIDLEHLK